MLNNFWLKPNINQPFTLNLHELIKLLKNKKINPKIIIKSYINRINEKIIILEQSHLLMKSIFTINLINYILILL